MTPRDPERDSLSQLLLSINTGPEPVFLLGAGASISSGVPGAADLVTLAARWIYAARHSKDPKDPSIRPGDSASVLEELGCSGDTAASFSRMMEFLDRPRDLRRKFLLTVLSEAGQPQVGYQRFAEFLRRGWVHTALTTNFDTLIKVAVGPTPLIEVSRVDQAALISTAPQHPTLVYLHGRAEEYGERTTPEETAALPPELISALDPILRDHPIVVVGYRGAEQSVMRGLFFGRTVGRRPFPHGVFWCSHGRAAGELNPMVQQLATQLDRDFQLIRISDFDAFVANLEALWQRQPGRHRSFSQPAPATALPADLRPTQVRFDADSFDPQGVAELEAWAAKVGRGGAPLEKLALDAGLAAETGDGNLALTRSGALLLLRDPRYAIPGAFVSVHGSGAPSAIDGSLWQQFELASAEIEKANSPVRVKDAVSATRHPYPVDALKEVLVNALTHRDYEVDAPIELRLERDQMTVANPGGLEDDLLRRLRGPQYGITPLPEDILQKRLEAGYRGDDLTAYRNPVLADLFRVKGLMDKRGSGLADAFDAMDRAGGLLSTAIHPHNTGFRVTLRRRPMRIDPRTRTARPERLLVPYYTNVFPISALPAVLWSGATVLSTNPRERPWQAMSLAPVAVRGDQAFTFADLSQPSPLGAFMRLGDAKPLAIGDVASTPDGERLVVELLNETLYRACKGRGLLSVWRDSRRTVYFPCPRGPARYEQYRSRRGTETRRVARWPGNDRRYCEHKAASFAFERFGTAWALLVIPTYVFTYDGVRDKVPGHEHSSLATSAIADEYNPHVSADVIFWLSILAAGQDRLHLGATWSTPIEIATRPIHTEGIPPSERGGDDT